MSLTTNSIGKANIEHGKAMILISSVRVANMLDAIMHAQNIPARYAYALVLFIFSNIQKSPIVNEFTSHSTLIYLLIRDRDLFTAYNIHFLNSSLILLPLNTILKVIITLF